MERGALTLRREVLCSEQEDIGALGVVDARATFEERHFPRSELEARLVARDEFFRAIDPPPPLLLLLLIIMIMIMMIIDDHA
jgi:hypothetical protein